MLAGLAAATVGPLFARAQQPLPVVGFIGSTSPGIYRDFIASFRKGLDDAGVVEGRDLAIEFRWAEGRYERLPALAAEFVNRKVAVILAGSLPTALAAKSATSTIPIVFVMGADPVKLGVVASLSRPGGNITGISQLYGALGAKRVELLRELAPGVQAIAVLTNPKNQNAKDHLNDVQAAARAIGLRTEVFSATEAGEIDAAFAGFGRRGAGALLVADDPFFGLERRRIVSLAERHAVPTMYYAREFVQAGGLVSYGSSASDNYRKAGLYVGRILRGAKPAELPVLQPTKFELVLSLKTAKKLGLAISRDFLARE